MIVIPLSIPIMGENSETVVSPISGIIIGVTNLPLRFESEAVFHIANYAKAGDVSDSIEAYQDDLDPLSDSIESDEPPLT